MDFRSRRSNRVGSCIGQSSRSHYRQQGPICPGDSFFETIFGQEVGLDIWGRIVGIGRLFDIRATQTSFGYQTPTGDYSPFGQDSFASDENTTTVYLLEDDAYRNLIMLKAMSNIIYATAKNINQLLINLFGTRGRAYYLTLGQMRARYVFEFELTPFEQALIQTDLLPRPSGVLIDFYQVTVPSTFGFSGSSFQPFEQGILHG